MRIFSVGLVLSGVEALMAEREQAEGPLPRVQAKRLNLFSISGTFHDVAPEAVPEPTTCALTMLSLVALFVIVRCLSVRSA